MHSYWLVKQEPESYSWDQFAKEKRTDWTGVRNFQARNNLRGMRKGDQVLYYHSGGSREVVGIAKVTKEAFPDPTADEGDWVAVELAAGKKLARPVTLAEIKGHRALKDIALVRNSRLSVMPLSKEAFEEICRLGGI
jgi:predicted RNA-binding protein with PUA-like domain